MKKVMIALVISGIAAISAHGFDSGAVKARVPFNFTIGRTEMPAGEYSFSRLPAPAVLAVENASDGRRIMATPLFQGRVNLQAPPVLVFHKIGGRYFLKKVTLGEGLSVQLQTGAAEREWLARGPAQEVSVAAASR